MFIFKHQNLLYFTVYICTSSLHEMKVLNSTSLRLFNQQQQEPGRKGERKSKGRKSRGECAVLEHFRLHRHLDVSNSEAYPFSDHLFEYGGEEKHPLP